LWKLFNFVFFPWNYTYKIFDVIPYYNVFFHSSKKMDNSNWSSSYKYVSYEPQGNFEKIFVPANVYYYGFFSTFFGVYIHILYTYKSSDTSRPHEYGRLLGNKFHRCIRLIKFPVERFSSFLGVQTRRIRTAFPKS